MPKDVHIGQHMIRGAYPAVEINAATIVRGSFLIRGPQPAVKAILPPRYGESNHVSVARANLVAGFHLLLAVGLW
ncbi:hypothetical protein ACFIOY_35280 [Bradyrhizobium sp. TZ2]